ncbi:MAG TPA: hypothetical protein VGR21_02230 [Cryptosporangiaceae bacterium]|nr:hypothetical protein [Cryptosporangiaceae bacterium]
MKTYTVVAERSGGWWAIEVPAVTGVFTQAKRLDQVEAMARDALAAFLDVAPDSFDVVVEPRFPDEVGEAREAREAARLAEKRAEQLTVRTLRHLLDAGWTVRDAGRALEVSPQRVSQLAPKSKRVADKDARKAG